MSEEHETAIIEMTTESSAYRISPVGIEFLRELDQQAWSELGAKLGKAGRSIGFLIGDWLNYGEGKGEWGNAYENAMRITGLDNQTLRHYSSVSKKVQLCMRMHNLSFYHHQKVASLKTDEEKRKWLHIASQERDKQDGKPMSARRLAKSILLGRVAKVEEMSVPPNDRGIDNMSPHVTRIVVLWGKLKRSGYLGNTSVDDMLDLIDELQPVVDIVQELHEAVSEAGGGSAGSHID